MPLKKCVECPERFTHHGIVHCNMVSPAKQVTDDIPNWCPLPDYQPAKPVLEDFRGTYPELMDEAVNFLKKKAEEVGLRNVEIYAQRHHDRHIDLWCISVLVHSMDTGRDVSFILPDRVIDQQEITRKLRETKEHLKQFPVR